MSVTMAQMSELLQQFSPQDFACDWDNSGFHVRLNGEVTGVLICLDVTRDIIRFSAERRCNLILSHHPLLFRPQNHVDCAEYTGEMLNLLLKNQISLFCAHTTVDSAPWGINAYWRDELKLRDAVLLEETKAGCAGLGYIGDLPQKTTVRALCDFIKRRFSIDTLRVGGDLDKSICRVALCGGSASDLIPRAKALGGEVFITGEIKHNFYVENPDIVLIEAGHFDTEKCFVDLAARYLQNAANRLQYNLNICVPEQLTRYYCNY